MVPRRPPGDRFPGAAAASILLAALLPHPAPASDGPADPATIEHQIKAHFLVTVARFTEWPPDSFPDPAAPLTFCLIGDEPLESALVDMTHGRTAGGRGLAVLRPEIDSLPDGCHLLFVGAGDAARAGGILRPLHRAHVLTVGEGDEFVRQGGILGLSLHDNLVRFTVNADASRTAGITISSKILKLGRIVRDRPSRATR
jgi:hypothetical protein